MTLDHRALAYSDVAAKRWRVAPGEFEVLVGRSWAQIGLRGTFTITPP